MAKQPDDTDLIDALLALIEKHPRRRSYVPVTIASIRASLVSQTNLSCLSITEMNIRRKVKCRLPSLDPLPLEKAGYMGALFFMSPMSIFLQYGGEPYKTITRSKVDFGLGCAPVIVMPNQLALNLL